MMRLARQPGFMLLEVVVAVGLLVLGLAVIGAQLQSATDTTRETDHLARLVFLSEYRIAQLDSGLVQPPEEMDENAPVEVEEDFGRLFPQYASRVTISPTGVEELVAVQIDILYDPTRVITEEDGNLPDFDFNSDDELIVQTYHTMRIVPRPLNLVTDFGLEQEIADKINDDLKEAGIGSDGTGIDVENFNPGIFKDLDLEQLVELLSILQQAYGVDQSAMMQMIPEELRPQLDALLQGLGDEDESDDASGGEDTGTGERDDFTGGETESPDDSGGMDDAFNEDDGMDDAGSDFGDDVNPDDELKDDGARPDRPRGNNRGNRRGGGRRGERLR